MRLIDADAFMETIRTHDYPLRDYFNSTGRGMYTVGIQQAVDEQQTIDAVELVHGEWIEAEDLDGAMKGRVICSNCKNPFDCIVMTNDAIILTNQKTKYCPNCGAKMKGE